jgi:hypothetical protein
MLRSRAGFGSLVLDMASSTLRPRRAAGMLSSGSLTFVLVDYRNISPDHDACYSQVAGQNRQS